MYAVSGLKLYSLLVCFYLQMFIRDQQDVKMEYVNVHFLHPQFPFRSDFPMAHLISTVRFITYAVIMQLVCGVTGHLSLSAVPVHDECLV